jgi:hypothetical protein
LHDPLGNADRVGDGRLERWRWTTVPIREPTGCEDARGDQQNSLSTFVHAGKHSTSFRLVFAYPSVYPENRTALEFSRSRSEPLVYFLQA